MPNTGDTVVSEILHHQFWMVESPRKSWDLYHPSTGAGFWSRNGASLVRFLRKHDRMRMMKSSGGGMNHH
jgi:hypothetical protein